MEQSWTRVTSWLTKYAPGSFRALDPPATAQDVERAQDRLQVALPAALVRLLSMTNGASFSPDQQFGSRFLPGGFSLLPVAEIPDRADMLNSIVLSLGSDMLGYWWHPHWVPFAETISGDALAVDQRPGSGQGRVGEFHHDGYTEFNLGASLTDYITLVATALEQQQDFGYYRPRVVDERLAWDVVVS